MKQWNAESIKALREKYKLRQHQLADFLGTRQQTVSEWELELYEPKNAYSKVLNLAEAHLKTMFEAAGEDYKTFHRNLEAVHGIEFRTKFDSKVGKNGHKKKVREVKAG